MSEFPVRLKQMLKIRDVSQRKLAYDTGISESIISRYVQGKYIPKYDNLIKISKYLRCNPAYLYGESDIYDDEDGELLAKFLNKVDPSVQEFNEMSIEDRHRVYIYTKLKDFDLDTLLDIEEYVSFKSQSKRNKNN